MAIEKIINVQVQGNADEAVGSLRAQLRQAVIDVAVLSEKFGATSKEAVNAAKRAAELKDQIGDARALTDAFNPDAKFKALSSSLAGVAGGFAAVQGGMALLGTESAAVEETLLKVQSAMALSQGIQALGESVDSFKQLGAVIQSNGLAQKAYTGATAIAATVQKLFTGAVNTTATSFNALKTAIISTGIGALVVAIGLAISYLSSMGDASEDAAKKQEALNVAVDRSNDLLNDELKGIDSVNKARKARAKIAGESQKELDKIDKDANEERLKALKDNYERQKKLLDDSNGDTKKQQEATKKAYKAYLDEISKQEVDTLEKTASEVEKIRDKQAEDAKNKRDKDKAEAEARAKKDAEDLKAALKAQQEATIENELELSKAIGDAQDANSAYLISKQEEEERAVNDKYFRLIELAKQNGIDTTDLEIAQMNELNNIRLGYQQQDYENEKANSEAKIKLAEAEAAAKEALLSKTASTATRAAELLGKNTAAGKALAIAAATINTYQGITAELATKTTTPFEIGLKIANVALIAATGFKAVKDIVSVKVPGSGGGGGSAPSIGSAGGGTSAPQFNVVGNSGVNQLASVVANKEQPPIKTYVVASDVTSGQSLDRNIVKSASLG